MNVVSLADLRDQAFHHLKLGARLLDSQRSANTFSSRDEADALQRIYVINLDRRPDRWRLVKRELDRFVDRHGKRLSNIARRFSAIDARYLELPPAAELLTPMFTLADQLTVDPNPKLSIDAKAHAQQIRMSKPEIAVALSHIEIWKLIATGGAPSALVLEDDVFFTLGFAGKLRRAWTALSNPHTGVGNFDLLYLSFKEVGERPNRNGSSPTRRTQPGIWQASGYVLTKAGAQKLLGQLPVHGPVDLWLNLQFANLVVYTASRSMIEQRIGEPSTNSYSVLPVLSQLGVITREKPLLHGTKRTLDPLIAVGDAGTGLTSIATALSMIGYTCCSDYSTLPADEQTKLLANERGRLFNAYVNIGSVSGDLLQQIATSNPNARFICTSPTPDLSDVPSDRVLNLGPDVEDKWKALSDFLRVEYPSFAYPDMVEIGQRNLRYRVPRKSRDALDLAHDSSPWILTGDPAWSGLGVENSLSEDRFVVEWSAGDRINDHDWFVRGDTFPSNLALFAPGNVERQDGSHTTLLLKAESTSVREFTAAAIASRQSYLYGSFKAELRPSRIPGLITGFFLHRNGPRQEIDIEFLGKDTTKMLVNVYYNPGPEGTKLEYGYRGTPTVIGLGFDAADDFHLYEIDWQPSGISWRVDGKDVYERAIWDPTPIPDQPLELNLNLWHSRSTELAGKLNRRDLPASASVRTMHVATPLGTSTSGSTPC